MNSQYAWQEPGYYESAAWLAETMDTVRELNKALAYLDSRPFAVKRKHELSWPHSLTEGHLRHIQERISEKCAGWFEPQGPRFANVSCSQCGGEFGPGDHGYSDCRSHRQPRYEVRVVGPAGCEYDSPGRFNFPSDAWRAARAFSRAHAGFAVDVIDIEDPEYPVEDLWEDEHEELQNGQFGAGA